MILQDRLSLSFDALVEQYISEPAGMDHTIHPAVADDTKPSLLLSAGGYQTTANDMARFFLGMNDGSIIDATDWQRLIMDSRYLFDNYSLGAVVETRNDVLTNGHSGGGARANIRYAPEHQVGAMVCTADKDNRGFAMVLARMLIDEMVTGVPPKIPLLVALTDFDAMTGEQVIAAYEEAASIPNRYDLTDTESLLNVIGYTFLERE